MFIQFTMHETSNMKAPELCYLGFVSSRPETDIGDRAF